MTLNVRISTNRDQQYLAHVQTVANNGSDVPQAIREVGHLIPGASVELVAYQGQDIVVSESNIPLKTAYDDHDLNGALIIEPDGLDIRQMLLGVRGGAKYTRKGWSGKGVYIELQWPDANSKKKAPYIYIVNTEREGYDADDTKGLVPWLPSPNDILALDWKEV